MRKRLWDDIGTAILALVLALVVWVNATYQNDRPVEDIFPQPIPITMLNNPTGLVITNDPPDRVQIKIRAFSSSWNTLQSEDFNAVADLAGLGEGMHAVPVVVSSTDPTVTILSVHPSTLYVRLEPLKQELKEVVVNLTDREEVPLGYRVYAPEVEPNLVRIEGPSSLVDRVSRLEVNLSLLNERATVEKEMTPQPVDERGQSVTGVLLTPPQVRVRVVIERKQNYREVAVRVRTTGHPARGYYVSGVDVVPATVTVVGPPSVIDAMGGLVDTRGELDISGATRMIAERMELALPEGVSVVGTKEGEKATVLVTVGIDAVTGGTTLELPLKVKKLRSDLVAKLSVSEVDVILTGPAILLDELETDLLEAYVDLSGLGPGTYQVKPVVSLLVSQDSKLRDLVVSDISPKSIEVTISEPPTPTPTPTATVTQMPTFTPTAAITVTGTITISVESPAPTSAATLTPSPKASGA
ncbi:MAG: hypothetical protein H5T69_16285 [Chloroflexi bacterium]|nr:hypothetical protein [Chloroflexota bacterium]